MKFFIRIFIFAFFAITPFYADASLEITEIMYDLGGTDTNREWIEIYNNGEESVDVLTWKFFEENTNHNLVASQGDTVLVKGGYAVIADKPEKFLVDWPDFTGVILDSSFSLKNTGETLTLKDADLNIIDSVGYTSDWGAEGDGNSLQKIGGEWKAAAPTPGTANEASSENASEDPPIEESVSPSQEQDIGEQMIIVTEEKIYANAGADKIAVVGADTEFRGTALGFKKEPLSNARYFWSFGDMEYREGQNITHFYKYPGEYIAVLEVSSGSHSASDKIVVKVVENKIKVLEADANSVKIKNDSSFDINISGWFLRGSGKTFFFPRNSFIKSGATLAISSELTKVFVNETFRTVELLYPNGSSADFYILPYKIQTATPSGGVAAAAKSLNANENDIPQNHTHLAVATNPLAAVIDGEREKGSVGETLLETVEAASSNMEDGIVLVAEDGKNGNLGKWLALVVSLGFLGAAGLYFVRRHGGV
ncbi:MAG: lamin tail domain-containing protein [bacterium]|nr:lamin tail domain-containing protein [bacterium]